MFRKNTKKQQPALISAASELPEKQRKRLENSLTGAFYKELFSRIDEQSFAVLYSEKDSRPNVPVNVLGGFLLYTPWPVFTVGGSKVAWTMYRWSSMYLEFIFLAIMVDAVV